MAWILNAATLPPQVPAGEGLESLTTLGGGGGSSGVAAGAAAALPELRQRAELQLVDLLAVAAAVLALARWNTRAQRSSQRARHVTRPAAAQVITWSARLQVAALPAGRAGPPRAPMLPRRLPAPNVSAGHLTPLEAVAPAGGGAGRPRSRPPLQSAGLGGAVLQDSGSSNTHRMRPGTPTGSGRGWPRTHLGRPLHVLLEALAPLACWQ